jgi:hypothetical protein
MSFVALEKERKPQVFENEMFRKIFGSKKDDES